MPPHMNHTWVLLRGLTREAQHWGVFPLELARALPHARIETPDLPGAGVLWRERCPLRVEDMVEACRSQLHKAGLSPPYYLLGLSLGGMAAAAWAGKWPQELAACVLVNTSMRPFSPAHHRLRPINLFALPRLLSTGDPAAVEQTILGLTSSSPEHHTDVLERWLAICRARPVSVANTLRQLFAAARYRHPGPKPDVPVLVVGSLGDKLVDPRCSRALAANWGLDAVMHPTAGHDLPLDAGPWLAGQLAGWVARGAQPERLESGPNGP
jgi:pimeloyl-ACP methyl ester carboxylesterase